MNVHARQGHSTASMSSDRQGFAHPIRNLEALTIEPGMHVADFGAGSGHYALGIAEQLGKAGRIYAVEVQKDLLRRLHTEAHKRGLEERIEFIWGDLEIPGGSKIAGGHLDLVLVSNLLFQVPDKAAIFKEARRILKPSGRLAVIDWSASFGGLGPRKEDIVTKEAAIETARGCGFEVVREFEAGAHHYGVLLRQIPVTVRVDHR